MGPGSDAVVQQVFVPQLTFGIQMGMGSLASQNYDLR